MSEVTRRLNSKHRIIPTEPMMDLNVAVLSKQKLKYKLKPAILDGSSNEGSKFNDFKNTDSRSAEANFSDLKSGMSPSGLISRRKAPFR